MRTILGMAQRPGAWSRILEGLGLAVREEAPDTTGYQANVAPPPRSEVSSLSQALTIDAVYRAFFVLETAAMQLTVDVWRGQDRIEPPTWIRNPDPLGSNSGSAFLGETVMSLAARGNAYWRKRWNSDRSAVLALEVLDPRTVTVQLDPNTGRSRFSHNGETLTARDISHLKLIRTKGEAEGLGPIQSARRMLAGAAAQRDYADNWFTTGGVPNGLLKTEQTLNDEQAEQYKKRWMENQRPDQVAVLGAGLSYEPLLLKPEETQWLESQKWTVTSVARLFGIPSSYILAPVEGANLTYQNQQQEDLAFVRYTLMRYLREIEEAFTALLPRGQSARFNVDALLRADTRARYEAHRVGLEAGFITVPEVREIEGLNPDVVPEPRRQIDQQEETADA